MVALFLSPPVTHPHRHADESASILASQDLTGARDLSSRLSLKVETLEETIAGLRAETEAARKRCSEAELELAQVDR